MSRVTCNKCGNLEGLGCHCNDPACKHLQLSDDDDLKFVQRVLESDAPIEDVLEARDIIIELRKRLRQLN